MKPATPPLLHRESWESLGITSWLLPFVTPQLLRHKSPTVPQLDCFQCRKVQEGVSTPQVKCCDIVPKLVNFQVGLILQKESHPVLEQWIAERRADPYGIHIPPVLASHHKDSRRASKAGSPCPLLHEVDSQGVCSIYEFRSATCLGYHCYYPSMLWRETWSCLQHLIELWQDSLSRYLVWTSDIDRQHIADFWETWEGSLWEGTQQKDEPYSVFWQHWKGKEVEFFLHCADKVGNLTPTQVEDLKLLQGEQVLRRGHEWNPNASMDTLWEHLQSPPSPRPPPPALRERYKDGVPAYALDTRHFLAEQESYLLWYLEQFGEEEKSGFQKWWKKFRLWGN